MRRVRAYQDEARRARHHRPRARARSVEARGQPRACCATSSLVAFWLPLTVPGAPLHVPPLVFARIAAPRLTPRKDVIATTKLLIGMLLVLAGVRVRRSAILWWKRRLRWAALARDRAAAVGLGDAARARSPAPRAPRPRRAVAPAAVSPRGARAARRARGSSSTDVIAMVNDGEAARASKRCFRRIIPIDVEESWRARRNADLDAELDKDAPKTAEKPLDTSLLHGLARGHGSMARLGSVPARARLRRRGATRIRRASTRSRTSRARSPNSSSSAPGTARSTRSRTRWAA